MEKRVSRSFYPYYGYDENGKNEYDYVTNQVSMIDLWNRLHLNRQIKNNEMIDNVYNY